MSGSEHARLVTLGARWLKRRGFSVVATEIRALDCRGQPDVIGFRATCSAVIEAKASRSDFLADAHKPERSRGGGLGTYRFYLCPPEIISPGDLPPRWGLLEAMTKGLRLAVGPAGNLWPGTGADSADRQAFQHASSAERERAILFSIARRQASRAPLPAASVPAVSAHAD